MENQNQNTSQTAGNQTNNAEGANTQQEEMMKMLASGYDMLQNKAAQLPEMLTTACASAMNGVKNMSTTRKVIAGGAVALGAALLITKLAKGKNKNGEYSRYSKKNKR